MKRRLELDDKQFNTLMHLLEYEFDQETNYQENGNCNAELLEEYFELFKIAYAAKYQNQYLVGALIYNDLIKSKQQ